MADEILCYLERQRNCTATAPSFDEAPAPSSPYTGPSETADELYRAISRTYHALRLLMAGLALGLPLILWLASDPHVLLPSLSAYYHFDHASSIAYGAGDARDLFVGTLCAIGAFLIGYRGYTSTENWALNIAGVAIISIALYPMGWFGQGGTAAQVHNVSAMLFFAAVAYVCLAESGATLRLAADHRRKQLTRVYGALGSLLIALPLTLLALNMIEVRGVSGRLVWLLEVTLMALFGTFWIVKTLEIRATERELGLVRSAQ